MEYQEYIKTYILKEEYLPFYREVLRTVGGIMNGKEKQAHEAIAKYFIYRCEKEGIVKKAVMRDLMFGNLSFIETFMNLIRPHIIENIDLYFQLRATYYPVCLN